VASSVRPVLNKEMKGREIRNRKERMEKENKGREEGKRKERKGKEKTGRPLSTSARQCCIPSS